jgi:hypothetical protein
MTPGDHIIAFNPDGTLGAGTTFNTPSAPQVTAWAMTGAPQTRNVNLGTVGQADELIQFGGPFAVSRFDQCGLHFCNS